MRKKKRANGEGHIRERKDGRWEGIYYYQGKPKSIYGKSHTEVRKRLDLIKADMERGSYLVPTKLTLEDWLQYWLKEYAYTVVRPSTYVNYEGSCRNHIIPMLGKEKLLTLSSDCIQAFIKSKQKTGRADGKPGGLSGKTLLNIYNTLHSALDQAVQARKIPFNPILGVKRPAVDEVEMRVFDLEEQERMASAAYAVPELHAFGIVFALATGLRIGEVCGLKWNDISSRDRLFKVRRTINRLPIIDENGNVLSKTEIVIGPPKTKKGRRTIVIFPELWNDLMWYQQQQEQLKSATPNYVDEGYVFANNYGSYLEPHTFADLFGRVCKLAKVEDAHFHTTRHTFATRALEQGMDIKVLSELLGHESAKTTLDRYGHVLQSHKIESMNKMRSIYTQRQVDWNEASVDELPFDEDNPLQNVIYFKRPNDQGVDHNLVGI